MTIKRKIDSKFVNWSPTRLASKILVESLTIRSIKNNDKVVIPSEEMSPPLSQLLEVLSEKWNPDTTLFVLSSILTTLIFSVYHSLIVLNILVGLTDFKWGLEKWSIPFYSTNKTRGYLCKFSLYDLKRKTIKKLPPL